MHHGIMAMILSPDHTVILDNAERYGQADAGLWRLRAPFDGDLAIARAQGSGELLRATLLPV